MDEIKDQDINAKIKKLYDCKENKFISQLEGFLIENFLFLSAFNYRCIGLLSLERKFYDISSRFFFLATVNNSEAEDFFLKSQDDIRDVLSFKRLLITVFYIKVATNEEVAGCVSYYISKGNVELAQTIYAKYKLKSKTSFHLTAAGAELSVIENNVYMAERFYEQMIEKEGALAAIYFKRPFNILFQHGRILDAYRIKSNMATLIANSDNEKGKNIEIYYQKCAAYTFLKRYEEASKMLEIKLKDLIASSKYSSLYSLRFYLNLVLGNDYENSLFQYLGNIKPSMNDHELDEFYLYHKLISGKSVAVVGPADSKLNNGAEIDTFDVVIRSNLTCLNDINEYSEKFGSRADICYFSNKMRLNKDNEFEKVLCFFKENLKAINFRRKEQYLDAKNYGLETARLYAHCLQPFASSNKAMHGIQKIIWDILKFNPKRIKVFSVDFYLGDKLFANNNYAGFDRSSQQYNLIPGSEHCHYSGFEFMKEMERIGLIEVDSEVEEYLSISSFDYIHKLANKVN